MGSEMCIRDRAAEPVAAADSVPVTPTKPVEEEAEDMDFDMEWD